MSTVTEMSYKDQVTAALAGLLEWIKGNFETEQGLTARATKEGWPYLTYRYSALQDGREWELYLIDQIKYALQTLQIMGAVKIVFRLEPWIQLETDEGRHSIRTRFAAVNAQGAPVVTGMHTEEGAESPLAVVEDGVIKSAPKPPVLGYDFVAPSPQAILHCALLCYSVVKALNDAHNEYTIPWEASKNSTQDGVMFILSNPDAPASASHENWMKYKMADGWTLGPNKDEKIKTHPLLVPYDMLSPYQRSKDAIFGALVRTYFGL